MEADASSLIQGTSILSTEDTGELQVENQQGSHELETRNREAGENYYLSDYKGRGYALIFNHKTFDPSSGQRDRPGTEHDVANLQKCFANLKFDCDVYNDLALKEIISKLEDWNKKDTSMYGSILVVVLSHGERNGKIWAKDKHYHTSDIWNPFTKNTSLQHKPKIFIFQACRGLHKEAVRGDIEGINIGKNALSYSNYIQNNNTCECKNVQRVPNSTDVLVAYSTVENCESIRNTEHGTWYIRCLCTELNKLQKQNVDLLSMFTNVTRNLVEENDGGNAKEFTYGQTPTFVSSLTKKIYLSNAAPFDRSKSLDYDWNQYKWRGQARIYCDSSHEQEAKLLAETLEIFDFTSVVRKFDCHEVYIEDINKLHDNFHDEGCIFIAILAKFEESDHFSKYLPQLINSTSLSFQEKRVTLAGKPKIFFFFDKQTETASEMYQTDDIFHAKYATQHSDYLIVRGFGEGFFREFLVQLKYQKNIIDSVTTVIASNLKNTYKHVSHFETTLRANICLDKKMNAIPIEFVQDTTEDFNNDGIYFLIQQRNVDGYIERVEPMSQIKSSMFAKETGRLVDVVITGMPGVGKSQLALSYAGKSRRIYKNIIMLDATSEESLQHYFLLLAKKCNLIQNNEKNAFQTNDVYNYLSASNTLFIFDNANPSMIKYLPKNTSEYEKLYFIFTSTTIDWDLSGESKVKTLIKLDTFSENETTEFLMKKFDNKSYDVQHIKQLGDEVDNFPLSLDLTAAYIIQSAEEGIEKPILRYIEAISRQEGNSSEGQVHLNKLEKVWKPTLQKLEENGSSNDALKLLEVISYIEPHNIPVTLFEPNTSKKNSRMLNALRVLKKYSIISHYNNKIHIHKLLQNITRAQIEQNSKVEDVLKKGMTLINKQLLQSKEDIGYYDLASDFSLHSAKLIKNSIQYPQILTEFPDITICTIIRLNMEFNCKLSSDIAEKVQPIFNCAVGLASSSLELKAIKAETKIRLGLYNEALEEIIMVIDDNWDNRNDFQNLWNFALLYHYKAMALQKLGKLEESVDCYRLVIDFQTRRVNKKDQRLMASKHNLACVLQELERYEDALHLFFENLDILNSISAINAFRNMNKTSTMIEISKILQANGFYYDSKCMMDNAIKDLENLVTSKSPLVLSEKHNRNVLLDSLGVKTSEILADCLEIYETKCKVLGKHHPSTQHTGARLAALYNRTDSFEEAQKLYNEVIELLEESLGKTHETVLAIKHNTSMGKELSGNYFEALHSYMEIYTEKCEILGKEHNSTLNTRERIAYCLYMLKDAEPALEIYNEIIELNIKKYGKNHIDLQTTRHNRAMVLNLLEKNDEAIMEFKDIVSIDEEIFGTDHPMTLRTKERIANVLRETGKLVESKKMFDEILPKLKNHFGSQHDDVICARVNRARVLEDMGKRLSAIKIYYRCNDILCAKHGMSHYLTNIVHDLYNSIHDKLFKDVGYLSDTDDGDISDDFEYPHVEQASDNNSSSEVDDENEVDNDTLNIEEDIEP